MKWEVHFNKAQFQNHDEYIARLEMGELSTEAVSSNKKQARQDAADKMVALLHKKYGSLDNIKKASMIRRKLKKREKEAERLQRRAVRQAEFAEFGQHFTFADGRRQENTAKRY